MMNTTRRGGSAWGVGVGVAVVVVVVVALMVVSASCVSVKLNKRDPHVYKMDEGKIANLMRTRGFAGNNIHMGGGVLTALQTYYANITIGSDVQVFQVLIDTGSANLVVPSAGCTTCGNSPGYNISSSYYGSYISYYDDRCRTANNRCFPDHPETSWATNVTCVFGPPFSLGDNCGFGITYGGGSASLGGALAVDTVCFDGTSLCTDTIFGLADIESPAGAFSTLPLQGILGLSSEYSSCNPTCVPTIIDNLFNEGQIANTYSVCLSPSNGGSLDIGEVNELHYTGELRYVPLEVERWFNVILESISVGPQTIPVPFYHYRTMNDVIGSFVDSGTSLILMGPYIYETFQEVFQANYSSLPGISGNNSFFTGSCFDASEISPSLSSYPSVTFSIRDEYGDILDLDVPPSSYLMLTPDSSQYCFGFTSVAGVGVVLGDVFMENFYIVFDRANLRLGFAPSSDYC